MKDKTKNKIKVDYCTPCLAYSSKGHFDVWQKVISIFCVVALVAVWFSFPVQKVKAAGIDVVTTTLSDSEVVNTESRVAVVFTPTTALIVTDVITIYLGDATGGVEWEDDDADMLAEDVSCAGTGYTFDTYRNHIPKSDPIYLRKSN